MADFKTALEALAKGRLQFDALSRQLETMLQNNPGFATRLLVQLDESLELGLVDAKSYANLKRQINEFRRANAAQTESGGNVDPDATVFESENLSDNAGNENTLRKQDIHSEDETEVKGGRATGSEEKTELKGGKAIDSEDETELKTEGVIGSEDSTEVNERRRGGSDDSTELMGDSEGGSPVTSGKVDIDLSMDISNIDSFLESGTTPTGSDWEEPRAQHEYAPGHELGVGDVIKQRFKLLDVLGVGGMGKVFKGIDLLKEEARDKNPYMAIKLLNEDFKSHPEAFISLQRESSRQQKLAHPNIATVYDFDRIGGRGTPVFITMELMEGQPLNTYIKKVVKKQGGLPFAEAFTIVRQLAAALQYAHERRLVHSDFKPGNAFLCNDGTVKTLDFGIARAVKNPVTGEAEKTLFDPGKLGALTPAYASLEMLEGQEPDTRDDIYALGCVAYELLTGKHPFNKLPATTARENGLVPPAIKGLNKKQNRALRHALAFKREDRSQTVAEFIEEFEGKATWHKNPFTIAAGILLIIGIMLVNPGLDYLHQKEIEGIIADINTGNTSTIVSNLELIRLLEKTDQATITDQAREPLQRYFAAEIARQIDIGSSNYNFPAAENILAQAEEFYPQSLFVQQQRNDIEFNKKQKIADLYQDFIAALDPALAQDDPGSIDGTRTVLEVIRTRIDPQHPLLTDARPLNAYRLAANLAFENGNLEQALSFVTSGLQTAADDPLLVDLQTKIRNAVRVAELNQVLGEAENQLATLEDFRLYENQNVELAGLSTPEESPILSSLSAALRSAVNSELTRILNEGDRAQAEALAAEMGPMLGALLLDSELTRIKLAHLDGEERSSAIREMVENDKATIDSRLNSPDINNTQWEAGVLAAIRELDTLTQEDETIVVDLAGYRETLAQLYTDNALATLTENRFDAAENLVNRGLRIAPEATALIDAGNRVATGRAGYETQLRINGLKDQFQVAVEADNVTEANRILDNLKSELAVDDSYITTQAPRELAESYRRLAERSADTKEFSTALQLVEAAVNLNPRDAGMQALFEEYRAQVNIVDLSDTFRNARIFTETERADIARKVNEIERGAPGQYSNFLAQSETILAQRINFLGQSDENTAAALADTVSRIFSDSSVLADLRNRFRLEPWPERIVADGVLRSGELTRARNLLQGALEGEYAQHPDVLEYQKALEESMNAANEAYNNYLAAKEAAGGEYGKLNSAKRLLYRAQGLWTDNPEFTREETDVDILIANAPDNPAKRILQRANEDIAALSEADMQADWSPIPSDRACTPDKASYGSRARAICYDFVNTGWRGPQMVVVPAGGSVSNNFAIGKYEISVADWSKYCALTGNCKPVTDKTRFDDPVTGISLDDARKYVDWLSERTGKSYRLPSAEEWEYAASVGGELTAEAEEFRDIKGQLNCRVTLGDKVLKGTGIATIKSGRPNKWGLYNFVGNVQEWVQEGSGVTARGGAFSDAINNCDISTARPHNGNADATTGFRVILEDVS